LKFKKQETMSVKLYIAPGCPHCPNMIRMTGEMVKQGKLGHIEIINIAVENTLAKQANIRSVPTFVIGDFMLTGVQTETELLNWLQKSTVQTGREDYLNQEFEQGQLDHVIELVEQQNDWLDLMLDMLGSMQTPLTTRIGISAVFETLQGSELISRRIEQICRLAADQHESIRVDMAYLLGLSEDRAALTCLEKLTEDSFDEVRQTAQEAIETILDANPNPVE
jgi:glutaredoxin